MLADHDASYQFLSLAQGVVEDAARRDNDSREPVYGGLASGKDEMVMKARDEIFEEPLTWLASSLVGSDLSQHRVERGG